jgi:two-component system, cell cycle sensor histidine kinase and response regulator CckA
MPYERNFPDFPEKFAVLRGQAEALVGRWPDSAPPSPVDALELIDELKIHQAELEIQNEELKRAQGVLSDLHREYERLYEFAPCGYLTLNPKRIVTRANLTAVSLLGETKHGLLHSGFSRFIAAGWADPCHDALHNAAKTGEKQCIELMLKKTNGSAGWIRADIEADRDDAGAAMQWRMVLLDITETKEMEARLRHARKMESIGTMAGGVAHNFNNILCVILGNAELAMDYAADTAPAREFLEQIMMAGQRGADLVKQILKFSHKTDHAYSRIDAVAVIGETIRFLRSVVPSTVDIRADLPHAELPFAADPAQVQQVLMNLCLNSAREIEEKGGTIDIAADIAALKPADVKQRPGLSPGEYVRIAVRDNGPGIDPGIIDRIFDPFFTTQEVGKGDGLGLSVVHGIVKDHGGAVFVDSRPGGGAVFTLFFPASSEKPRAEPGPTGEIPTGDETILFVDDEESIVNMAALMIGRLGYEVQTLLDPVAALDLFRSAPQRFDLVISDMTMPGMTGTALFEKLREIRPDIPVILCTGHSAQIDRAKAEALGFDGFVMKPVGGRELGMAIRKALDGAKAVIYDH